MSSDRQRSDDESPSTSSGSSDADQRDPAAPEPEEPEERKPSATQQKKNTKLSSKTTAKLSTSAKRYCVKKKGWARCQVVFQMDAPVDLTSVAIVQKYFLCCQFCLDLNELSFFLGGIEATFLELDF